MGQTILFPGSTPNRTSGSSQERNYVRKGAWAWKWACALLCLFAVAGCAGLITQNPLPTSGSGQLSITPSSMAFGDVEVGTSITQNITFSNSGTGSLTVSQAAVSGTGFTMTGQTFPITLSAGQSTSVSLQFAPAVTGSTTGSVSLVSNASSSPTSVALNGNGVKHQLSITPSNVSFGSVMVGMANTQTVTLTNSGTATLNISQGSVTGAGFGMSGLTFPFSLAPGQSSTFNAQFDPAVAGNASGTVSISSNAHNSPTVASLAGNGTQPALSLSATSLSFGNVVVGSSGSQALAITNTGTATLTISQPAVTGTTFSVSGATFPLNISPGANSSLTVNFGPTTAGSASGTLTIASNAPNSPAVVTLGGSGVQAALSATPATVSFGNVVVGNTGTQTVTLANSGTTSVTISQATVSGTAFNIGGLSLPTTLNAGQSAAFTVSFAPGSATGFTGSVSLTSNAQGSPLIIPLNGTGIAAQPQLTISPASVNFGSVNVGILATQSVSLTNSGNAALTISQASASGTGFSFTGLSLPQTINPGSSISFAAQFLPASTGGTSGSISITSNVSASPTAIALSGTGVQGTLTANPSSFNFGNVLMGSNGTQTITLSNSGTASVTISAANASGTGFSLTGLSVPLTLAAGQTTTFSAQFAPSATGSATGSLSITSNAPSSPLTIALSGTGVQPTLSVTPTSVSFGSVVTGSNNSQTLTLKNTGTASLTISQATVSGAGFTISGLTIPVTIAPGASNTFSAAFAPTTAGSVTGSLSLVSNASSSPLTIALSGSGISATFLLTANPTSLSFGNVSVGSSATQTVTLTNTGNSSVSISQVSVPTGFLTSGLAVTLGAGQTATFSVTFAPPSSGSVTGNANVISNASIPVTVTLAGTGVQPSVSVVPSSVSFGNVIVGSASTQSIALTNSGTANLTVTQATVSGNGVTTNGLTLPVTLTPGQTTNFNVAFSPTTTGSVSGGVSLASNAPTSPTIIAISGTGVAAASQLTASPTSLSFGSVGLGTNSSLSATLTNTGSANVTISNVSVSGAGFSASGVTSGTTLTPNQAVTLNVAFAPASAGSVTGSVSVVSNASNSPTTVVLSGTGVQLIAHSVDVSWTASASAVTGYNVYRGTVSGGPYTLLNSSQIALTAYTDSTVQSGQTYFYVVTAVDANNVESVYSNEVSAVVPFP